MGASINVEVWDSEEARWNDTECEVSLSITYSSYSNLSEALNLGECITSENGVGKDYSGATFDPTKVLAACLGYKFDPAHFGGFEVVSIGGPCNEQEVFEQYIHPLIQMAVAALQVNGYIVKS